MVEEKRHFSVSSGGKWFAHADVSESEARGRETCTTTGFMLSQLGTSPQGLSLERFPKWKTHQKPREFPHSRHDNKHALKDNITIFSDVWSIKTILDNCSDPCFVYSDLYLLCWFTSGGAETQVSHSIYQTDFMSTEVSDVPERSRRFPRNHKQKSAEAAKARAGEQFMWFEQHNVHCPDSLEMLASARRSAPSKIRNI
uniref:Domain of unknown function with conserved HDNR motif domain-containing protein n=1 Tax=Nothobranchius pienaari TaxID=704102 RepID=A0A1A8L6D7_9TELE